ncbi:hypothetical protein A3A39_04505 [Candidatus Kaiserbacteria bacterium RIFCSPLOWO2_01_FULL_54_13]|uniref:Serine aminopeptidase S33 domain-containing protein n=1 Tax=Candidatus Kaiserbacteria bacterium RIFCSPLOWO2_01_FULL_54_13 TaxID=1798512 RepID=A0A1F6F1L5_9BACT|nr:MAG: hypothetical protein A3A39_04505 [Candidatus Kaiserbacteria bacterium RIFCSPLOWO2_01_FULL_54_13]
MSLEHPKSAEKPGEFRTPFCNAIFKEFIAQYPEKTEAIKTIFKEIDAQAIDNLDVFRSTRFPGVSFSYSKLTVTPALIEKLGSLQFSETPTAAISETPEKTEGAEADPNAKRHDYFLFTAMNLPPGGHAFTAQDVAIDRFLRLIPLVAVPLARGEKPPQVNIYFLGDTTGLGGSVTPKWLIGTQLRGFNQDGELRAEFIKKVENAEPETEDKPHIVLQGVSKGAIIAEKTSRYLPQHLRKHTQRLLDNPAGDHGDEAILDRARKGLQVLAGYRRELAYHAGSNMMQNLSAEGGPFIRYFSNYLATKKGVPEDNRSQRSLKWGVVLSEVGNLVKGTSLDTQEVRSFIRRGIDDPVTKSDARTREVQEKVARGIPHPFFQRGRSSEIPFKGRHFFIYHRYHRWSTILDFAQKAGRGKKWDWSPKP